MDIVSYRGPGAAGGVSSGLETAWRNQHTTDVSWWFLGDDALKFLTPTSAQGQFVTQLNEQVVKDHYAYCNEFIWPVMHDLPQYASYEPTHRKHYKRFNMIFAQYINFEQATARRYFVQDYQLSMLPRLLGMQGGGRSNIFWHIPWPKNVKEEFVEPISEIARGMLSAESIGFHTAEYAQNFMAFVQLYLPEYRTNAGEQVVFKTNNTVAVSEMDLAVGAEQSPYVMRPMKPQLSSVASSTKLVVQPLGIDNERWVEMSQSESIAYDKIGVTPDERFILSVDRADYTKAVIDRLQIIDLLMEKNPEMRGNVAFVQICGRSRAGVPVFDKYWDDCRTLGNQVNSRWAKDNWTPIRWVDQSLNAKELAALYSVADAMMVNPVRDGLNLTAKEFVACRSANPGALLLSPGAGAWHEIGQHALAADPTRHEETAENVVRALNMSVEEKFARTTMMRHQLERNHLSMWWKQFVHASQQPHKVAAPTRKAKTA